MSLSLAGLTAIAAIVAMLLSGRVSPLVAFVLVPIVAAIVTGFGIDDIAMFYEQGFARVIPVAVMFVFAILFFGILQDAGLFEPVIRKVLSVSKGNVVSITVATALVASIAHLDGSGATTFLLTIPALLPTYQRLRMSPYLLLLLVGLGASIMNMLPWAGPLARIGSVLGMSPSELWRPLIPLQIFALVLLLALAVVLGLRENRRIKRLPSLDSDAALNDAATANIQETFRTQPAADKVPGWKMAFNALLLFAVVVALTMDTLPPALIFMIGVALALPVNIPQMDGQMQSIKRHAPNALVMATIIIAAGTFLGILNGSNMLSELSADIVAILPAAVVPYMHILIGIFGVPFDLILSTDAYFFAFLPIVIEVVGNAGVPAVSTAYAMVIGNIIGTFVSPLAPAVWLALQLAGLEMGKHIRYSFGIMWAFSLVLLLFGYLIGAITL
ncbi:Magnesium citrate secondary transporter [Halomonas citrativorans]|uniref:Magnesium citrate secondary transporter n=1 Tax=Halomonas citrativorans TaxID=2742612 RepID=A0A1R4HUT2_9GAMM|nr:citrate:proton symporter [Halomonas citrativorans]SJN11124.1 Magnesium citrate secondary transporter [Halomonas citrativorans]